MKDLKVEYDGTIRDAKKNIYQFAFGNHGFDPAKVNINEAKGEVYPVNIERLAAKLNRGDGPDDDRTDEAEVLTEEEIEDIVEGCAWRSNIHEVMYDQMRKKQDGVLRRELNKIRLVPDKYEDLKKYIVTKYHTCRATPGEWRRHHRSPEHRRAPDPDHPQHVPHSGKAPAVGGWQARGDLEHEQEAQGEDVHGLLQNQVRDV